MTLHEKNEAFVEKMSNEFLGKLCEIQCSKREFLELLDVVEVCLDAQREATQSDIDRENKLREMDEGD